jgi:hypothetical protein
MKLLWILIFCICAQFTAFAREIPVSFRLAPNRPFYESADVMVDSAEYNTLILRVKSRKNGTGRLFWANSYDMRFNQPKSIWFTIKRGEKNYVFNISSQNPNWVGWARRFLVYPEFDYQNVEIIGAKVTKGNLLTNISSGWQEFWGPRGRMVVGSTINTMQSVNIFGRPIFFYIYWLLFLIFIGQLAWEVRAALIAGKGIDITELLPKAGKRLVVAIIIVWVTLEASTLVSNWNNIKGDFKFVGKNIDEKLTIANTGDFYPFIQFCRENIPEDATFDSRIPPYYNDIKATYYLYPIKYMKDGEFLVVYDKQPGKEMLEKYKPWRKFRKGAYILKKK